MLARQWSRSRETEKPWLSILSTGDVICVYVHLYAQMYFSFDYVKGLNIPILAQIRPLLAIVGASDAIS